MHGSEPASRKPPLSRLLRGRGILQGDEKAAADRRAAARRGGVRPSASRGGLRGLRRPRARARVGRVRAARRAAGAPRRADRSRTLRGRGLAGRERACERRPRVAPRLGGRRAAAVRAPSRRCRGSSSRASFLLLVAVLAGLADLSAAWIVLVMAVAWVARRAHRVGGRREALPLAPRRDRAAGRCRLEAGGRHDRAVGHAGRRGDGRRERPGPGVEDDRGQAARQAEAEAVPEPEPEPAPKRRRGLRRRKPAETSAADPAGDPWEA